jgi:hypothetical protein
VWLWVKQVREGGVTLKASTACLAEQFPEPDIDQVDRGLSRAMRVDNG